MDYEEAATRIVEAIIGRDGTVALGAGGSGDHDAYIKAVGFDAGVLYAEVYAAVVAAHSGAAAAAGPPRTTATHRVG